MNEYYISPIINNNDNNNNGYHLIEYLFSVSGPRQSSLLILTHTILTTTTDIDAIIKQFCTWYLGRLVNLLISEGGMRTPKKDNMSY